jgi:hypothetical protein
MSLREGYPVARPPGPHYCLSLSRGENMDSIPLGNASSFNDLSHFHSFLRQIKKLFAKLYRPPPLCP